MVCLEMKSLKYLTLLSFVAIIACNTGPLDNTMPVFSVGPNTMVEFASGNLSEDGHRFVSNPTDYGGLFGWGTGDNLDNTSEDYHDYPVFHDWAENIGEGWRTPTVAEWRYLLFERQNADQKWAPATVDSVHGLLILPDNFVLPANCRFESRHLRRTVNVYTTTQWQKMEAAGAIFLPCSGFRWGTDIYGHNCEGIYWTSTPTGDYGAHSMYFSLDTLNTDPDGERHFGHSVRLVRDISSERSNR